MYQEDVIFPAQLIKRWAPAVYPHCQQKVSISFTMLIFKVKFFFNNMKQKLIFF